MSKTFSQRGPFRYPYYRCRSYIGGRGPCRGVSILAYNLERFVCDIINQTPEFAALHNDWKLLTGDEQREALPRIVECCEYTKKLLRLTLFGDAAQRLGQSAALSAGVAGQ
jgi:hypothetical protein